MVDFNKVDEEKSLDDVLSGESFDEQAAPEETVSRGFDFSFLTAETGEGAIEDYLDHPLNFNQSKSVAQMLRGFTGLLGNLKLAIIDIVMGGLQFAKERKAVN